MTKGLKGLINLRDRLR